MKSEPNCRLTAFFSLPLILIGLFSPCPAETTPTTAVAIRVDITKRKGPITPIWAWFGYDEPNYTLSKDGKKLLSELAALSPVPVFVRAHNLMTSGDGTPALKWGSTNIYTEDADGNAVYDWTIVDQLFDTYVQRGMKPLVQFGFMPEALSIKPQPYRHHWKPGDPYDDIYTGWAYPPKDYGKWGELVFHWVRHCAERYGRDEAASWRWELWNEPDAPYWKGTTQEYCTLYDYTADAVKRALPEAPVGGPHVTGPAGGRGARFLREFLTHCAEGANAATGKVGAPLDFVAFHAKGNPRVIEGVVQMDMGAQLRDIRAGFEIVRSFEAFKDLPIIIGESDPEGCAACSIERYPHNDYRNGTMFSSYTAASFARKYDLADEYGVNFLGAVSWSFTFPEQPWFSGFRSLATNGVDKPVLNVFRMFGMMRGSRVEVSGDLAYDAQAICRGSVRGERPDIGALAAADDRGATVMVWNYHDKNIDAPAALVELTLTGIAAKQALLHHYRIDSDHSNAYEAWKRMGSPQTPSSEQIDQLEKAGQLQLLTSPEWIRVNDGRAVIPMMLPRQGVSLIKAEWQ